MSNKTTENFLQVMADFEWPDPPKQIFRLYYNDDGTPKCYTMDDLPGKYIEVDKETYISRLWNVRVIDNKLKIFTPAVVVSTLHPDPLAGQCCHKQDICVIVSENTEHTKWKITANETH